MPGAVHAVIGTDDGRVSEEALALFNDLKPEGDAAEFTNEVVEGVVANAEEAFQVCARTIEALQTIGFFGADKIVWLKGANFLADDRTGGAERTKAGVDALL
ncbi:MAG: DNA polymerase III subunit delta, partial [Akkermansiaceae bacterium]|nr:DNA polymerase III subunit delta [Akkermansiaceae bacterium]